MTSKTQHPSTMEKAAFIGCKFLVTGHIQRKSKWLSVHPRKGNINGREARRDYLNESYILSDYIIER